MKKITVIFIVVIVLLSFVEICCLEEKEEIYRIKWGIDWLNFSSVEQKAYLYGMRNGRRIALDDCLDKFMPDFEDLVLKQMTREKAEELTKWWEEMVEVLFSEYDKYEDFLALNENDVRDVMTDLYKDPANMYIEIYRICEISCQKLKGEDIEPSLQEAKEEALFFNR